MGTNLIVVGAFVSVVFALAAFGIYLMLNLGQPYRIVKNLEDGTYSAEERRWGFWWYRISFGVDVSEVRGINARVGAQNRFVTYDEAAEKLRPYMKRTRDKKLVVGKVSFDEERDYYHIDKV